MSSLDPTEIQLTARIAHLDFLQRVIARQVHNGTNIKNFSLYMIAAVAGVAAIFEVPVLAFLALPLMAVFSILDALYLRLERGYRAKYNEVAAAPYDPISTFSLTEAGGCRFIDAYASKFNVWFYGGLTGVALIFGALLEWL